MIENPNDAFDVLIMAKTFHNLNTSSTFFILFAIFLFCLPSAAKSDHFSRKLSPETLGLKEEKLTFLRFYFHDIVSGKNPSAVRVAEAPSTNKSATGFGAVVMMDDPLTMKPELSSKLVGRAQGIYALASQTEGSLLMVFNFVFLEEKYNGSTLSVLGRNSVFSTKKEMPVVGGTGVFKFARGYAKSRTHTFNTQTGDAVVEFKVYVLHY